MFALAGYTDYLDGKLARKYQWETPSGQILDPLCDKLFALIFFTLLLLLDACPNWFLGFFITVALFQSFGFMVLKFVRGLSLSQLYPLPMGKINLGIQFLWIGVILIDIYLRNSFPRNFHFSPLFYNLGYGLVATCHLVTFFRYFFYHHTRLIPSPNQSPTSHPEFA